MLANGNHGRYSSLLLSMYFVDVHKHSGFTHRTHLRIFSIVIERILKEAVQLESSFLLLHNFLTIIRGSIAT